MRRFFAARAQLALLLAVFLLLYVLVGLRISAAATASAWSSATTPIATLADDVRLGPLSAIDDSATRWGFDSEHIHGVVRRFAGEPLASVVRGSCPERCPRNAAPPARVNVAAVVKVRIYDSDPARLTAAELVQWIQFHRLAGVQRVFVCDSFVASQPHESVLPALWPLVRSGVVEYFNFSEFAPPFMNDPLIAQSHCYNVVPLAGAVDWVTTIDMDEYVFCPSDAEPGFIARRLAEVADDVSTLVLENYLMHDLFNASEELLIRRVRRRNRQAARGLTKYFTRPDRTLDYDVHHPTLRSGRGIVNGSALAFLHAWGPRAFGWNATAVPLPIAAQLVPAPEPDTIAAALLECARLCSRDEFHWIKKAGPPFWQPLS